jgi:TPR repeat protein
VEKDATKALALFTAAADAGNAEAQLALGYLYMKGDGVAADATKALALFTSAAEGGSRDAQYNVGLAYMRGQGVSQVR